MVQFRRDWLMNMDTIREEMNQLLEHFAGSKPPTIRFAPAVWEPAIDVYETVDELVITIELAGVKEADTEILVDRGTLIIRGRRKKALPASGKRAYYQMEIASGPFERAVTLPVAVDFANTKASYKDGLIEVILPKAKKEGTRKVTIKSG